MMPRHHKNANDLLDKYCQEILLYNLNQMINSIFTQQAMMAFMLIMQMIYSANGIITEWFLHEKVMIVSGLQVS